MIIIAHQGAILVAEDPATWSGLHFDLHDATGRFPWAATLSDLQLGRTFTAPSPTALLEDAIRDVEKAVANLRRAR